MVIYIHGKQVKNDLDICMHNVKVIVHCHNPSANFSPSVVLENHSHMNRYQHWHIAHVLIINLVLVQIQLRW